MATTLISAVRQEYRNAPSIMIISSAPRISARVRLLIESSMKVAGRKMAESTSIPCRPGRSSSSASSTPSGHVQGVRPGQLLDDEHQAVALVDHRVADQRLVVPDQVGHVLQPDLPAVLVSGSGCLARSSEVTIGWTCRTLVRCCRPVDPPAAADEVALRVREQAGVEGVRRGGHDLLEGDLLPVMPLLVGLHLEHVQPLAPDRHVGDAGDPQQPRPDLPVRRHRQVHHVDVGVAARQADLEHPAGRRHRLQHHRRRRPGGQRRSDAWRCAPAPAGAPRGGRCPARTAARSARAARPTWTGSR